MKRNILICFLFLFATALQSSSLKEYSIEKLEKILVKEFHPYPTYGDDIWFKIPDSIRLVYINQAEMRIHDNWESLPASLFMEYKQTGDRNRYQNVYFKKRSQLTTLAMGELLEGKGRFILPLINGILSTCEETWWGLPIGHARTTKKQGDWMNENNIQTNLAGLLDYTYNPTSVTLDIPHKNLTFKGYRRKNGEVGIRNEVWIIPTVGCVNGIINQLAEGLRRETGGKGVDAIMAYPHNYGCSQLGDDHENTKKILRDMVLHPNAGAVLVVGLGCENNQPDVFREFLGEYDEDRVKFMVTQKVGDEYEEGMKLLRELYEKASKDERVDVPLSELRVGLKCGGSDGFSGITANPLLGMFSDFLVAQGGTSVLTEVPEMFGAETILMNRCRNKELFEETVKLINDFKEYFLSHGEPVGENPSPGNKAGGISTLEDKALGCTQKCGKSYVEGVLPYGERLKVKGLNLLSAPGNDLVAATALASSM